MLGQQSLGGFQSLKVDTNRVRRDNEARIKNKEFGVVLKNGLIINDGKNPTKDSRLALVAENRKKYELTESEISELVDEDLMFRLKREKRLEFTLYLQGNNKIEDGMEVEEIKSIDQIIADTRKKLKDVEDRVYFEIYKQHPTREHPFEIDSTNTKKRK